MTESDLNWIILAVVFLAFYNHAKIKEYKNKQTKLDSVLAKQDSIKHEIDKDKVLKLQKMNQQLEKQTDALSSQLSALTTEIKSIKRLLKTFIKNENTNNVQSFLKKYENLEVEKVEIPDNIFIKKDEFGGIYITHENIYSDGFYIIKFRKKIL